MTAHDPGRTSASHLPLYRACSYSGRADVTLPRDEPIEASVVGTARHVVYAELALGRVPTLEMLEAADVDEAHTSNVKDWLSDNLADVPYEKRIVERAFAYDPKTDTARELATTGHRDYSQARPGELVGSVDLAWIEGGVLHVRDWKCGLRSRVDRAAENMQLRPLALYLARALGVGDADVGPLMVNDEGNVDGSDIAALDDFELSAVAGEVTALIESIPGSTPNMGPWCAEKHCKLNGLCPAHVNVWSGVAKLLPDIPAMMPGEALPSPQTPKHAAFVALALPVLEAVAEAMKRSLKQWVDDHGDIAMPDGGRWGKTYREVRVLKVLPNTLDVLREHGVESAVEVKTVTKVTVGSVSEACKKTTKRGQGAKKEREVMAALGEAVQTTVIPQYGYVKPNKKELEAAE